MKNRYTQSLATFCLLLFFSASSLSAQQDDAAFAVLSGASSVEELDESELERIGHFRLKPLSINTASRSRLTSSGLMTQFQVASLVDYRSRNGDILSLAELSLVDGFSEEIVRSLSPYISLDSFAAPGKSSVSSYSSHDLMARGAIKTSGLSYSIKYRYSYGNMLTLSLAHKPEYLSGSLSVQKGRVSLILGDYNARFGQGLSLWNGFSISSLPTINSFSKRPTGISPVWSLSESSGAIRGAAAQYENGFMTSGLFFSKNECGVYSTLYGRHSEYQFLVFRSDSLSFSFSPRLYFGKTDLYSEIAFNGKINAVAGLIYNFSYNHKLALRARYIQSKGLSSSVGLQLSDFYASLDASKSADNYQFKVISYKKFNFGSKLSMIPRVNLKWIPGDSFKRELRTDFAYSTGVFSLNLRTHYAHAVSDAFLTYVEPGLRLGDNYAWLRATAFCVDNWADRIYAYERDAPGNFNVPAYYGRGYSLSFAGALKFKYGKLYLRASTTQYFSKAKPSKSEFKLQYNISL